MPPCKNERMNRRRNVAWGVLLLGALWSASVSAASPEIIIPEGTRITLQLNDHLSTHSNSEGDPFTAVAIAPVCVGDRMVIPKGSVVTGSISRIVRPGRLRGKAVMNLQFQSITIPGRGRLPIEASLVRLVYAGGGSGEVRSEGTIEGGGSVESDTGKVLTPGLAGTGIGVLAGGAKGAAIGGTVGTAIGLATVFATRGKDLEVRRGSQMDIALDRPLTIPQEGENFSARR